MRNILNYLCGQGKKSNKSKLEGSGLGEVSFFFSCFAAAKKAMIKDRGGFDLTKKMERILIVAFHNFHSHFYSM